MIRTLVIAVVCLTVSQLLLSQGIVRRFLAARA
jgi:hypothetical protein